MFKTFKAFRRKEGNRVSVIVLVASMLLVVTFMDTWILFQQTHQQTWESGVFQLESISGKLEATISDAEKLTMKLAIAARQHMDDRKELERFLYEKKSEVLAGGAGALNVYMAGPDWTIIPDFDFPDTYIATERVWYTGGVAAGGKTYVTPPYQDAMTGNICFSVSVLLGDGETVLGVDYTMDSIQGYVLQMFRGRDGETDSAAVPGYAVIVTDEGIIAGCSDAELIGKRLVSELPDYAGIYSLAKSQSGVATSRIKADFLYENLFAAKSGNGWYLIVSESDWEMYKHAYIQLLVTSVLSLALFAIVIVLYLLAIRNQKHAEEALASKEEFLSGITGELQAPLRRIIERSSRERAAEAEDPQEDFAAIHASGERLSEMVEQLMSYSSIVRQEKSGGDGRKQEAKTGTSRKFQRIIVVFMVLVMLVSLYINVSATYRWGNVLMQSEAENYEFKLSEWLNTQKSILDMFCSVISTNPEMLDDYEGTVDYLNRITEQYPEISVSYMTNPDRKHTVYMNNGWEPDADWHVEERQWYIDTMASSTGWSISAPYYDDQTGGYCLTISKVVKDSQTGEFLGVFGIDFFMDKLVDILGDSYSDTGYAFMVDPEGEIINHPYGSYQMSQEKTTNISELVYGEAKTDGRTTQLIRDYDRSWKILIAARNPESKFTVYVVSRMGRIYGRVFVYSGICLLVFLVCILLVYRLLSDLIRWQDSTNAKLKDAADAAIAAGKAKSQFLAQMSHEIRTPINAVLGMNEMILREAKEEGILDYSENIQSAGRTLLSLINSILDFSKIEDGKMTLEPVKYDLSSLINDLVHSISERARAKSLEFNVEVEAGLPSMLYGDDVRIRQIIMNLLTNAVKYTEAGKVELRFGEAERKGGVVVLAVSVRDTGIGIRQEDMGKLFESFERLDEKRNRNIEGTGLGMSIVTKLLAMMDSKLDVDSVYGKGSIFSFELTQEIVDQEPIGDYASRLALSRRGAAETGSRMMVADGAKILVVDDNEMNLKVARNLLKLSGVVPDLASSGEEAIRIVQEKHYHIVFLDHMMPKMDGIETLQVMQAKQLLGHGTTVIALTANAVVGARDKYLEAGFDDYLSKPIEVESLQKKLEKYLPKGLVSWQKQEEEAPTEAPAAEGVSGVGAAVAVAEEETLEFEPGAAGGAEEGEALEFGEAAAVAEEETLEFEPGGAVVVAEEEALEFEPGGAGVEAEDAVLEFGPGGADGEEVFEFGPGGADDGDEILEFGPGESDDGDEILEFGPEAAAPVKAASPVSLEDRLAEAGIDTKSGLGYSGGDLDFYRELLQDYAESCPVKAGELQQYYTKKDWKNYQILVHAVKSTSRTIGAADLSERALQLEKAAEQEDAAFLEAQHECFLVDYRALAAKIAG